MEKENRLLTINEAAEILAVTPRAVYEWIRNGKLQGVKIGVLWRIRPEDLEAFIERGKVYKKKGGMRNEAGKDD